MTMPAKCTQCRKGSCDDCATLGLYCSCCGKIWENPPLYEVED